MKKNEEGEGEREGEREKGRERDWYPVNKSLYAHARTHVHTCMCACMHAHTHTHTRTHTSHQGGHHGIPTAGSVPLPACAGAAAERWLYTGAALLMTQNTHASTWWCGLAIILRQPNGHASGQFSELRGGLPVLECCCDYFSGATKVVSIWMCEVFALSPLVKKTRPLLTSVLCLGTWCNLASNRDGLVY